jgi:hypothetical protein
VRPATLRGLGSDQVLVVINGVGELHEPELNKSYNLLARPFIFVRDKRLGPLFRWLLAQEMICVREHFGDGVGCERVVVTADGSAAVH